MAAKKQDVVVEDGAVYVLRAGTPVYVKTADICSMTGKSNQWIGQLVAQGTLHKRSTLHGSLFDVTEKNLLTFLLQIAVKRAFANKLAVIRRKDEVHKWTRSKTRSF